MTITKEDMASQGPGSASSSPNVSTSTNDLFDRVTPKRKRVIRACDECKRKKVKCDSKSPCAHCVNYGYDCTYDRVSNRQNAPAQYIIALENRIERMKKLLKDSLPEAEYQAKIEGTTSNSTANVKEIHVDSDQQASATVHAPRKPSSEGSETLLENMIHATGELDIDKDGNSEYYGHSSGLAFLQQAHQRMDSVTPDDEDMDNLDSPPIATAILQIFDSPLPEKIIRDLDVAVTGLLPSKEFANELISSALDDACALMRFVHRPSFDAHVDRIYAIEPGDYKTEDSRFLCLLYVVLGLGYLFPRANADKQGCQRSMLQGMRYYVCARRMIDVTNCRDLTSLQTLICMIIFLQTSARLSTCHTYVGIAVTSAVRMGLHRAAFKNFDPIEREVRKRMFWTIQRLDTYVGAVLGLPKMISDEDIDQELPAEVDDRYVERDGITSPPDKSVTSIQAAPNAHVRLLRILSKTIKHVYPVNGIEQSATRKLGVYFVSYAKVKEIEGELGDWSNSLPVELKHASQGPKTYMRAKCQLSMAFAHVKMLLYRPFLHYIPQTYGMHLDGHRRACAVACIDVSREVIRIAENMRREGLLNGVSWLTVYTTFLATASLVFCLGETTAGGGETLPLLDEARTGLHWLESLRCRNIGAERCYATLQILWEKLQERLQAREKDNGERNIGTVPTEENEVNIAQPLASDGTDQQPSSSPLFAPPLQPSDSPLLTRTQPLARTIPSHVTTNPSLLSSQPSPMSPLHYAPPGQLSFAADPLLSSITHAPIDPPTASTMATMTYGSFQPAAPGNGNGDPLAAVPYSDFFGWGNEGVFGPTPETEGGAYGLNQQQGFWTAGEYETSGGNGREGDISERWSGRGDEWG